MYINFLLLLYYINTWEKPWGFWNVLVFCFIYVFLFILNLFTSNGNCYELHKNKDILYFNLYKAIESIYVIKYEPENKCQHL